MLTCVFIQYSDERNSRRTPCFGAKLQLTVAEPPNPSREQAICHTVSATHQAPGQLTPRKQSPSRLYRTLTGSPTHKCSNFHMWRLSCRVHSDTCICAWLCKMRVQPGGSEKWEYRWVWEGRGHFPGQKELFDEMGGGGADRGRRMKSMKRRQRWERQREKLPSCERLQSFLTLSSIPADSMRHPTLQRGQSHAIFQAYSALLHPCRSSMRGLVVPGFHKVYFNRHAP